MNALIRNNTIKPNRLIGLKKKKLQV